MATVMGLVIPYDERRKAYMRRIDVSGGDDLTALVGGPLEMVRLSPNSHMYINEEAKLSFPPLPYNISVNRILRHTPFRLPKPNALFMGPLGEGMTDKDGNDFIAGNVVILGSHMAPEEGDVHPEVIRWCDQAEVEVIQQVNGLNVPRDGTARVGHRESRTERLARQEAAARATTGNPYSGRSADSMKLRAHLAEDEMRDKLTEADKELGGVLGMFRKPGRHREDG